MTYQVAVRPATLYQSKSGTEKPSLKKGDPKAGKEPETVLVQTDKNPRREPSYIGVTHTQRA